VASDPTPAAARRPSKFVSKIAQPTTPSSQMGAPSLPDGAEEFQSFIGNQEVEDYGEESKGNLGSGKKSQVDRTGITSAYAKRNSITKRGDINLANHDSQWKI